MCFINNKALLAETFKCSLSSNRHFKTSNTYLKFSRCQESILVLQPYVDLRSLEIYINNQAGNCLQGFSKAPFHLQESAGGSSTLSSSESIIFCTIFGSRMLNASPIPTTATLQLEPFSFPSANASLTEITP